MPTRDIRARLALEGEHEFKRAINDADEAIKTLNAEQKLADAQFRATGDAQQYAADKARILQEKIAEQQKAVDAAKSAIEKLKEKGVDPNSKAMQDWNRKLLTARTRLVTMQTELDKTETELDQQGKELDETGQQAENYNEDLKRIGDGVDFQNTISAIDDMRGHLESIIRTTAHAAKALWDMERGAGQWADEIATAAQQAGVDAETYQSWEYASRFIDTSVETIISSRQKLLNNMKSGSEETAKVFNQLGVVTRNTDGTLRDQTDTFWDVIDALGRIDDETTRDAYAQTLLGRSAKELNPLIDAGSAAYKDLAEEGREVAVVSQENVDALTALDDANQSLDARLQKTQRTIQASLAEPFTQLSTSLSEILDRFNEFLETDEGKAALERVGNAITGLISSFTDMDFEGIVNGAASALNGVTSALEWVSENQQLVVAAVKAIALAWTGLTVSKEVLTVLQLLKTINWSKISKIGGGAAASAAGNAAGNAAAGAGGGLLSRAGAAIKSGASKVGGALKTGAAKAGEAIKVAAPVVGGALAKASPYMLFAAATAGGSAALDRYATERDYGGYNRAEENYAELMADTANERIRQMQRVMDAFHEAVEATDEQYGGYDINKIKETFRENAQAVYDAMPELDFWQYFRDSVNYEDGLSAEEIEKIINAPDMLGDTWVDLGSAVVAGLAQGIEESQAQAAEAAAGMADGVAGAVAETLDINSPSVVMQEMGGNIAAGLAEGIILGTPAAVAAAQQMAAAVAAALQGIGAGAAGMGAAYGMAPMYNGAFAGAGAGGAGGGTLHATLMMDRRVVGEMVTPVVNSTLPTIVTAR